MPASRGLQDLSTLYLRRASSDVTETRRLAQDLLSAASASSMASPFSFASSSNQASAVVDIESGLGRSQTIHPGATTISASIDNLAAYKDTRFTAKQRRHDMQHLPQLQPLKVESAFGSVPTNVDIKSPRPGLARSQSVLEPLIRGSCTGQPPRERSLQDIALTLPRLAITMQDGVNFLLGDVLGRGQFGTVHRAIDAATGRIVAVKRIPISKQPKGEVDQMMHEIRLLRSLISPFVVRYEGYCIDESHVSIVMEYVENGSLQHTIRTFGCFNEELSASYTIKILQGLIYLHLKDVVHCDVKCANVLTTKKGDVKLSDFGIALNLAGQSTLKGQGVSGTPNWLAPEVISLRGTTKASDIWALGCTVLEMVTGKPPYNGQNAMNTMYSIVEDCHPPLPTSISSKLRNFLLLCFQKEPRARPSAQELMHHPWLTQFWRAKSKIGELGDRASNHCEPLCATNDEDITTQHCPIIKRNVSSQGLSNAALTNSGRPKVISLRPSSAPVSLTQEQRASLAVDRISHAAVAMFHLHQVQCSICGSLMRKAVHCQRCDVIAHAKCLANSSLSCTASLESAAARLRPHKQPAQWLKRRSALPGTGACIDSINLDELALLPEEPAHKDRFFRNSGRHGCRMM